jgi:hypothetical protein
LGNRQLLRLLGGGGLQKKLTINQPGDVYEQEADRVAEQVMRISDPARTADAPDLLQGKSFHRLQRCSCGGSSSSGEECEECKSKVMRMQRSATAEASAEAPPIVDEVLRSPGQPLDRSTREFMEPRFGVDFGDVRLHTGAKAEESAKSVNALAYTVGRDVVLGSGQDASASSSTLRVLAHELAHVVQQQSSDAGTTQRLQRVLGPCPDIATPHTLLKKDAQDPGVREVQRKLNLFHAHERALGNKGVDNAPLAEDCIFGPLTLGAVIDFQRQVFPGDPREHDGDVGDHTWRELDKIAGTPTPLPDLPSPSSPTDPQNRIKNVNVTLGVRPGITIFPTATQIRVQTDGDVQALGSADVIGSADCDKFTFGFIQMCRPFDVYRVTYHSPSANADFVVDASSTLRAGRPVLDTLAPGGLFARSESAADKSSRCANPRQEKHRFSLFFDSPGRNFPKNPSLNPDAFITGMAWQSFFLTSFSVQVPDGTLRHLQSFFWDAIFCATFGQPSPGNDLGPNLADTRRVSVGNPNNGINDSDFLRLAASPPATTCNQVAQAALPFNPTATGPGTFTTNCPVP